jgi:hypothetical protein
VDRRAADGFSVFADDPDRDDRRGVEPDDDFAWAFGETGRWKIAYPSARTSRL